jgi:hypothetical protein
MRRGSRATAAVVRHVLLSWLFNIRVLGPYPVMGHGPEPIPQAGGAAPGFNAPVAQLVRAHA